MERVKKVSIEDREKMVSFFINGMHMTDIGKKFNIPHQTVRYHVKKRIPFNKYDEIIKKHTKIKNLKNRKYTANYTYFHNIDHQNKAYWLGFLYGDGCIPRFDTVQLNITDLSLLKKFKDDLKSNHPIKCYQKKDNRNIMDCYIKRSVINGRSVYHSKNTYTLNIMDRKMVKDLIKWGCIPNKTLKLKKIPNIELKYYPDFIRGYFDADGSIWYYDNNGYYRINFEVCGNIEFIEEIRAILVNEGFFKVKLFKKGNNTYYLRYSGRKNAYKFYNFLYHDNNTRCLDRKRKKFEEFFNIIGH